MLTDQEVNTHGIKAEEVWHNFQNEIAAKNQGEQSLNLNNFGHLASRVLHDHLRSAPPPGVDSQTTYSAISYNSNGQIDGRKRMAKE